VWSKALAKAAPYSKYEIDVGAEQVDRAAGVKPRLDVDQCAVRLRTETCVVKLQLEVKVFDEVPAHAGGDGSLNSNCFEQRAQCGVEAGGKPCGSG